MDAALNNYVAIHYESRAYELAALVHRGVGASVGLTSWAKLRSPQGQGWPLGYRYIRDPAGDADRHPGAEPATVEENVAQLRSANRPMTPHHLTAMRARFGTAEGVSVAERKPLGVAGVLAIRGAKGNPRDVLLLLRRQIHGGPVGPPAYMVMHSGIDKITAASHSLFYVGITVGRALSGFLTMRIQGPGHDSASAKCWCSLASSPCSCHLPHHLGVVVGLVVIGFGCADLSVRHPLDAGLRLRRDKSRIAIVGVQMACAYLGSLLMPPLVRHHRAICDNQSLPWYLLVLLKC